MKHLKSFKKLNESVFDDFISQSRLYQDLGDEDDYDNMRDDLSNIQGKREITEPVKERILRIITNYLRPELTGIEFVGFGQRNPHALELYFKTVCGMEPDFLVNFYDDNFFVVECNVPVIFPRSITVVTLYYIIDGWDGFEEWAEKTTPYYGNEATMSLLKSPLRELDSEMKSIDNNKFLELCRLYPHIRVSIKGFLKEYYFFDGDKHIATLEVRPGGKGFLQCHKSYKEKLFGE